MIKTLALKQNKNILVVSAISIVLALLVLYIFQINNLVAKSYTLENYQRNIKKISLENEKIGSSLAGESSLKKIEMKVAELGFEKINRIHYVQILDNTVASAR